MEAPTPNTIDTNGGAVLEGDAVIGRDFVGRDQYNINIYLTPSAKQLGVAVAPSDLHVINFARALSSVQRAEIEKLINQPIGVILGEEVLFDHDCPYGTQCLPIINRVGLTRAQWQTLPIVVNLPGFAPGAACLLAELHGIMGYFPPIIRFRQRAGENPSPFHVAEIINLQRLRDATRDQR